MERFKKLQKRVTAAVRTKLLVALSFVCFDHSGFSSLCMYVLASTNCFDWLCVAALLSEPCLRRGRQRRRQTARTQWQTHSRGRRGLLPPRLQRTRFRRLQNPSCVHNFTSIVQRCAPAMHPSARRLMWCLTPVECVVLVQLKFLRTYGGPPIAPADFLARNGLLPEEDEGAATELFGRSEEHNAAQGAATASRPRSGTSFSLGSPPASSPRTRSVTMHRFEGPGSESDVSERSYATALSQSEAGQSAKWKKTLVRPACTACAAGDGQQLIAMQLPLIVHRCGYSESSVQSM